MQTYTNLSLHGKRNPNLKISFLIFGFTTSFLLTLYGPELWGGIVGMGVLVLISLTLTRLDILHPLTWFTPIFYLYSISLPLLAATGEMPFRDFTETLFLEWVALATFMIVMGIPKKNTLSIDGSQLKGFDIILYPVYIVSFILTSLYLGYVFVNGISSKYLLTLDNSIFRSLVPFFSIYIVSFIMILAHSLSVKNKIPIKLILFSISYTMLALLVIGERDLILRVILATLFMFHVFNKRISRKKIIFFVSAILLTIPIMGNLRNIALRDSSMILNDSSWLFNLMSAEFVSAPRNLQTILENKDSWSFFYGKTYLWDLEQAFFKGTDSGGVWFNETFFPALYRIGGGNGFTIVGEGYINFGILGVIMMFTFLALVFKYIYIKATKNVIWLVIYITTIPITMYLIRGDLAVLFAQVSKHIILPIVLIYIMKIIISKSKTRKSFVLRSSKTS